jgi:YgiT-type zinc finger domain-containing protein
MQTCYFCNKGILEDRCVTVDFRWGKKLTIIEEVPAKVCNECGERYYSAATSRKMEEMATQKQANQVVEVPLVRFEPSSCAV